MTSTSQISPELRILFLRKFTNEILSSLIKEIHIKEKVTEEKIKQKILSPIPEPKFPLSPIFQPSKFTIQPKEEIKIQEIIPPKKTLEIKELRNPIIHRRKNTHLNPFQKIGNLIHPMQKSNQQKELVQSSQFQQPKQSNSQIKQPQQIPQIPPQVKALKEIKPNAEPRPEGFALGKIDLLLKDKEIQSIECSGPNKNLLIKKHDSINTTKITLTQEEITDILYSFAKQAKIPVVGGILKAAVGNLVISAVISEFVGSRFIINKITPYSLIQN